MYKIGTKFKASVEYEIVNNSENDCYRVRWLEAGVYKTGAQDKEALTRFINSDIWKLTYIPPKEKCNLCRHRIC